MVEQKEHRADDLSPGGFHVVLTDSGGRTIEGLKVEVKLSDGTTVQRETDSEGILTVPGEDDGEVEIKLLGEAETEDESSGSEDEAKEGGEGTDQQDDDQGDTGGGESGDNESREGSSDEASSEDSDDADASDEESDSGEEEDSGSEDSPEGGADEGSEDDDKTSSDR